LLSPPLRHRRACSRSFKIWSSLFLISSDLRIADQVITVLVAIDAVIAQSPLMESSHIADAITADPIIADTITALVCPSLMQSSLVRPSLSP
jgi:hypothetical protein